MQPATLNKEFERPKAKPSRWTDAERKFVQAYFRHGDAGYAYRDAGLPEIPGKSDAFSAAQILKRSHVADYVKQRRMEIDDRLTVNPERVLNELAKIGFINIGKFLVHQDDGTAYVDLSRLEAHDAAAIAEIVSDTYIDRDGGGYDANGKPIPRAVKSLKVKLSSKTQALELLGKSQKLFTDRIEHDFADGVADRVAEARRLASRMLPAPKTIEGEVNGRKRE